MFGGKFRAGCSLFIIDFFMRHGIIVAEKEAKYVELAMRLRRLLSVPISPGKEKW